MISFKKLQLDSKDVFEKYTKYKYENSETSFANIFIWKDYFNVRFSEVCGYLVLIYTDTMGRDNAYMPYGDGNLKNCVDELREYFKSNGQKLKIISASLEMAEELDRLYTDVKITENIDFNDYVYTSESLINLSGKKLHSKKNHLNTFKKTYEYTYRAMKKEDFDDCISLAAKLMAKNRDKDSLSYKTEMKSLKNMFENFEELEVKGAIIEIDGNLAAFSVGEKLTENCALIHIEKADTSYNGIYAAMNNEFVKNEWSDYEFINREEDMGLEGLRKAKMSYRPHHMVRKFVCEFLCG